MRSLRELALAVKRGVKLLDKKIPNWRTVIKRHEDEFDFADGDYCVLGTLEHYAGRMRVLKEKKRIGNDYNSEHGRYSRACKALGISKGVLHRQHGFDGCIDDNNDESVRDTEMEFLSDLWKAEIGIK